MSLILRQRTPDLGAIHFMPSNIAGMVGLYQPRKNDAEAVINRAPGGVAATVGGTPIYNPWGAVLSQSGYLDTSFVPSGDTTVLVVARKVQTGNLTLVSTLAGSASSTPYMHLVMRNTDPSRFVMNVKTSPVTADVNIGYDFPVGDTSFEFISGSISATQIQMILPRNPTVVGGNPRTVTLSGTRDTISQTLRIGAPKIATALYPAATEIALVAIYNRVLAELEVRAIYAEAKVYFAKRGITI